MILDPPDQEVPEGYALEAYPKQAQFLEAVLSGNYSLLALGGGIRGTKTFTVLITLLILCRIYPGSRWAIVRKDLPTLRRNTIPSIDKIKLMVGGFLGDLKQDTWTYTCSNGSQIILFPESFVTDKELDRWRGLEVNGFALEEANELAEASKNKSIERAGAYIIPDPKTGKPLPVQPKPVILCTFNPCFNWPKQLFYDPYVAGTIAAPVYYLPATILDNPGIPAAYLESLKTLPPAEYKRFVEGDWTQEDDPDQLIRFEWVTRARNVERVPGARTLGWDVARYGDDETTGVIANGNSIEHVFMAQKVDTTRQAKIIATNYIHERGIDEESVRVDTVGVGGGVVDALADLGFRGVRSIESGSKPIERKTEGVVESFFKFKNIRSQMWWEFREKLRLGQFHFPDGLPDKLISDLLSVHYSIDVDKVIKVESKDDIKKRIGRSTDYGDALVMAVFALPKVPRRPVIAPTFGQYTFSA